MLKAAFPVHGETQRSSGGWRGGCTSGSGLGGLTRFELGSVWIMWDGPALRQDHPGPRRQITRRSGHSWMGQGDLRETGEAPLGFFACCAGGLRAGLYTRLLLFNNSFIESQYFANISLFNALQN